jgi:hypothetical protein
MNLQLGEQRHQLRLRVRQRPVDQPPPAGIERDDVMRLAGDVDPAEDVEPGRVRGPGESGCGHQASFLQTGRPALDEAPAATLREGIHNRAMSLSAVTHVLRSPVTTPL